MPTLMLPTDEPAPPRESGAKRRRSATIRRQLALPGTRRKLERELVTDDELAAMVRACNDRYDGGVRARAAILVLAHGGLRCAELVGVRPKDVAEDGALTIQRGKGGARRVVQLSSAAAVALARWLERRRSWLECLSTVEERYAPVFCTRLGRPLPSSYVRRLVARIGARVTCKRVHPHGLRHYCALGLERRGCTLTEIQTQLGHRHASTTSAYLTRLDPQRVRARVRAAWDGAP